MDRIYAGIVILSTLFISTLPAASSEIDELTLKQAITLALEKSLDLRILSLEEDSAKGQKDNEITGQRLGSKHCESSDYNKNFLSQV